MSLNQDILRADTEMQEVIASLPTTPPLRTGEYILNDTGEMNRVLIGRNIVVKVPRGSTDEARQVATYDASILQALSSQHTPSPVEIPSYVMVQNDRPPYYSVSSKVPGLVLTPAAVRKFSLAEQRDYGRTSGRFIAWLAGQVSIENCVRNQQLSGVQLFDRIAWTEKILAETDLTTMPPLLAAALSELKIELPARQKDGSLDPTITGHSDLRPSNQTFKRTASGRALLGIFDFGMTKPSTPECELRHLATYGNDVLESAIESYEAATSIALSRDLIFFWAIAQTSSAYRAFLRKGKKAAIQDNQRALQKLMDTRADSVA